MGRLGKIDYIRIYNEDYSDYKELTEDNVHNFNKLFKLSSVCQRYGAVFFKSATDGSFYLGDTSVFNKYQIKISIPKSIYENQFDGAYFISISYNSNSVNSLKVGDTVVPFFKNTQYYTNYVMVPMPKYTGDSEIVEIVIDADLTIIDTGAVIPKIGIASHCFNNNIITCSGGEIPKRLVLNDTVLHSSSLNRYLKNDFFGNIISLTSDYNSVLCYSSYRNARVISKYMVFDYEGTIISSGIIKSWFNSIYVDDPYVSFKVLSGDSGTFEDGGPITKVLASTTSENIKLIITEVICTVPIKFLSLEREFISEERTSTSLAKPIQGAARPILKASNAGFQFFDTALNKPIWWNGTNWVDASGTEV
jgi:hypothetical protein